MTHPPTYASRTPGPDVSIMKLSHTEFRQTVFPTAHSLYGTHRLFTFPGHQPLKYLKVKMSGGDIKQHFPLLVSLYKYLL